MKNPKRIQPPRALEQSGGFRQRERIGRIWRRLIVADARLPRNGAVLDVGCGLGRMAMPLMGYLGSRGRYEGFDVDAQAVRWCQAHISARRPNFRFTAAEVQSRRYHPHGSQAAAQATFPYARASFDVAFLASVFTHLLPDAVARYLQELARVLKPGGRCVASYFLLNERSEAAIAEGRVKALHRFPERLEGCRVLSRELPESAVAHEEARVRELYVRSGFSIEEPVRYGRWAGQRSKLGQDVIFAVNLAAREK